MSSKPQYKTGVREKNEPPPPPPATIVFEDASLNYVLNTLLNHGHTFESLRKMSMVAIYDAYKNLYEAHQQAAQVSNA